MRPRKYSVAVSVLICLIFGLLASSPSSRVSAAPEFVLQFDGVDDRVTFGTAPGLGAQTFTLELWFKKTGAGTTTTSGTGGVTSAIPLLTKGRGEGENGTIDMNYFLGIDSVKRVLAADFEDTAGGVNHPIFGRTAICDNIWYHAAATYDGTTWRLYLNGELDAMVTVGTPGQFTPRFDSIQHAALATAMSSTGVAQGFFKGLIDEARIWNTARVQSAIVGHHGRGALRAAAEPGRPLGARRRRRHDGGQQRRDCPTGRSRPPCRSAFRYGSRRRLGLRDRTGAGQRRAAPDGGGGSRHVRRGELDARGVAVHG